LTDNILKVLKKKKYLNDVAGSHSRGFSQQNPGKPKMELVTGGKLLEQMLEEYFDPTTGIAHHVGFGCAESTWRDVWTIIDGDQLKTTPTSSFQADIRVPESLNTALLPCNSEATTQVIASSVATRPRRHVVAISSSGRLHSAPHPTIESQTQPERMTQSQSQPTTILNTPIPSQQDNAARLELKTPQRKRTSAGARITVYSSRKRMRVSRTIDILNVSWDSADVDSPTSQSEL
jgi:hypothetical protein